MKKEETFVIRPFTKDLLSGVLGLNKTAFVRYMKSIESELNREFPKYRKSQKIISPNIFYWICSDYGLSLEMVTERLINGLKYKPEEYDKVRKCYGLGSENPFFQF
jgi:hypothetical protein